MDRTRDGMYTYSLALLIEDSKEGSILGRQIVAQIAYSLIAGVILAAVIGIIAWLIRGSHRFRPSRLNP